MKYFLGLLLFISVHTFGQVLTPSHWEHTVSPDVAQVGDEVTLIFTATIDDNWYLYSNDFDPDCGPIVTSFNFETNASYKRIGKVKAINAIDKLDENFGCEVRIFKKKGVFHQRVKILSKQPKITGSYMFQVCSDIDGKCIPFDYDFEFTNIKVSAGNTQVGASKTENTTPPTLPLAQVEENNVPIIVAPDTLSTTPKASTYSSNEGPILDEHVIVKNEGDRSLIWFMIFAFVAGLAALLTPCVFPLIPMTVSFFTSQGKSKFQAIVYGFSIIIIYTIVGSALAPLMGPETANHLSTEWLPNIIFFSVFVIFALSFFGLFDITLPSGFINKMDSKSEKGGLIGVFFMAFTLVLVSFSCTGPIVGSILVSSAGGEFLKPIAGMFAFSLAFAVPFTLFAFFPRWLSSLPKSGGWLNTVKVLLGFLELALAFKFLSIADQAFHWGILDRDINIAIWIAIFTVMGIYLLGKIRLPHDSPTEYIGVWRLMMAIGTFTFVIYLIPGLWGAPLKALAGYLPPMYTHDFDLVSKNIDDDNYQICDNPSYADFLHLPHGLKGYFDYDEALACARAQNKPLFIDFTGHGCTNCREMEAVVWSHPEVLERLKENYVILALYVDDKTELPEVQWYTSTYDNKVKKTIGKQNADLQIRRLNNNAQPFYVLLGADEHVLLSPLSYDKDVDKFIEFLDKGVERYNKLY